VSRAEILWLRVIGVLLILLGSVLFASPRINYTTKRSVVHSDSIDVTAKGETSLAIPRPFSMLIIAGGVAAIVFSLRKPE
jgi:hypothetical protein